MKDIATPDPWTSLRRHTAARIALGRSGASLPTAEVLGFGLAHAQARDAVHLPLDIDAIERELQAQDFGCLRIHSAAPDRADYLRRPDRGRRLDAASREQLVACTNKDTDLLFVVADGLSSKAVQRHALPLLVEVRPYLEAAGFRLGPVLLARQSRVALGDEAGELLGASAVVMLIGERPGLSSPDSLGIYLTWQPRVGRSDAERNCISNVRPEGLGYAEAAMRLTWLLKEARRLQLTGIHLKDGSDALPLANAPAAAGVLGGS